MALNPYIVCLRVGMPWWLPLYLRGLCRLLRVAYFLRVGLSDAAREALIDHVADLVARSTTVVISAD